MSLCLWTVNSTGVSGFFVLFSFLFVFVFCLFVCLFFQSLRGTEWQAWVGVGYLPSPGQLGSYKYLSSLDSGLLVSQGQGFLRKEYCGVFQNISFSSSSARNLRGFFSDIY